MNASEKIPAVDVLKAIDPSTDTAFEKDLRYDLLAARAGKHAVYETVRLNRFFESNSESLTEESTARQLALQYFLMTAHKLNEAVSDENKQLWSDRFTQATTELYGQPEAELSLELGTRSMHDLLARAEAAGVDSTLIQDFKELRESYGLGDDLEHDEKSESKEAAQKVGKYLKEKYKDVFEVLDFDGVNGKISVAQFASQTEAALSILSQNHDEAWSGWTVDRDEKGSKLSVTASAKKIVVGMQRVDMRPLEAKGLFAHEVLVHGQRGLNGNKITSQLGKGLPGYLDSEEGLGVFVEYAVTGSIPEKNIDRYVDIALALGMIDGKPKNRQELVEFATTRALLRNEVAPVEEKSDLQTIKKSVYSHINRIYRGSLGNDYIGVFTKDIAYQKGFMSIDGYVDDALSKGEKVKDIMSYLLQAKFDPLNNRHVQELENAKNEKQS